MHSSFKSVSVIVFIVVFGSLSDGFVSDFSKAPRNILSTVSADDEYEYEEEDDDDESVSFTTASSMTAGTKQVTQDVVEYRAVTKTVTVTDEAYTTDSDGDLLMDAIDPNPSVRQSEYFTDIDKDSVPNAFDKHHDEDDFAFFDDVETDENNDGILDSYQR